VMDAAAASARARAREPGAERGGAVCTLGVCGACGVWLCVVIDSCVCGVCGVWGTGYGGTAGPGAGAQAVDPRRRLAARPAAAAAAAAAAAGLNQVGSLGAERLGRWTAATPVRSGEAAATPRAGGTRPAFCAASGRCGRPGGASQWVCCVRRAVG
jgi:hypothetical protein